MHGFLRRGGAVAALGVALGLGAGLTPPLHAQEEVTLRMWGLVNPNYPEFIQQAAEAFKATHPNVTIVFEEQPNEAFKTAIQVALVGSAPPDVFFNWAGEDSARLVRDGLVLDVTDLASAEGQFGNTLSDAWLSTLTVDGRLYGAPTDAVTKYFYYNTRFFDEHGLTPPTSFGGLLQLCRDIRAIDPEIVPLPLGNSERWKLNHYITILNERVMGNDALRGDYALTAPDDQLFTDPGYVTAWGKVLELQQAGCFQDAPNATSPEVSRAMFSSEVSPMIFCGSWCMSIFDGEGFTDYALFRFPPVEGGVSDGNSNMVVPQGLQVSAKTAHPEEAVAWLTHLTSPEMAKLFAQLRGALPSDPSLLGELTDATPQFLWTANDMASLATQYNVIDVELEASVANAYLDAGVEILNGTMTPEQAMESIRAAALAAKAAQN
jgi:raffinose/stachyose/melibiose transport system substrate-binding protein